MSNDTLKTLAVEVGLDLTRFDRDLVELRGKLEALGGSVRLPAGASPIAPIKQDITEVSAELRSFQAELIRAFDTLGATIAKSMARGSAAAEGAAKSTKKVGDAAEASSKSTKKLADETKEAALGVRQFVTEAARSADFILQNAEKKLRLVARARAQYIQAISTESYDRFAEGQESPPAWASYVSQVKDEMRRSLAPEIAQFALANEKVYGRSLRALITQANQLRDNLALEKQSTKESEAQVKLAERKDAALARQRLAAENSARQQAFNSANKQTVLNEKYTSLEVTDPTKFRNALVRAAKLVAGNKDDAALGQYGPAMVARAKEMLAQYPQISALESVLLSKRRDSSSELQLHNAQVLEYRKHQESVLKNAAEQARVEKQRNAALARGTQDAFDASRKQNALNEKYTSLEVTDPTKFRNALVRAAKLVAGNKDAAALYGPAMADRAKEMLAQYPQISALESVLLSKRRDSSSELQLHNAQVLEYRKHQESVLKNAAEQARVEKQRNAALARGTQDAFDASRKQNALNEKYASLEVTDPTKFRNALVRAAKLVSGDREEAALGQYGPAMVARAKEMLATSGSISAIEGQLVERIKARNAGLAQANAHVAEYRRQQAAVLAQEAQQQQLEARSERLRRYRPASYDKLVVNTAQAISVGEQVSPSRVAPSVLREAGALAGNAGLLSAKTRALSESAREATLRHQDLHAALRGVAGASGKLWLTYGNMVPLLAGFAAATATAAATLKSMKAGSEFEYQMKFVEMVADPAKGQKMADFRNEVRLTGESLKDMASNGVFGITELASALRTLSQAGFSLREARAILPKVMDLSVAGELDPKSAALALAGLKGAFGLTAEESAKAADMIGVAAAETQTDIQQLTESMKQASSAAQRYGVSMSFTTAALGKLAKQNITGSAAGTAFRNFLEDLQGRSKQSELILKQLGISGFDGDRIKSTPRLINEVLDAYTKLDARGRELFNKKALTERGGKSWYALFENAEGFSDLLKKVEFSNENGGFTSTFARGIKETFKVQVQGFKNDIEIALTEAFQSNRAGYGSALEGFREVVRSSEFKALVANLAEATTSVVRFMVEYRGVIGLLLQGLVAWKAFSLVQGLVASALLLTGSRSRLLQGLFMTERAATVALVGQVAQLTSARMGAVAATNAQAQAQLRLQATQVGAGTALAGARTAMAGALGALTGPVGAAVLTVGGLAATWLAVSNATENATERADTYRRTLESIDASKLYAKPDDFNDFKVREEKGFVARVNSVGRDSAGYVPDFKSKDEALKEMQQARSGFDSLRELAKKTYATNAKDRQVALQLISDRESSYFTEAKNRIELLVKSDAEAYKQRTALAEAYFQYMRANSLTNLRLIEDNSAAASWQSIDFAKVRETWGGVKSAKTAYDKATGMFSSGDAVTKLVNSGTASLRELSTLQKSLADVANQGNLSPTDTSARLGQVRQVLGVVNSLLDTVNKVAAGPYANAGIRNLKTSLESLQTQTVKVQTTLTKARANATQVATQGASNSIVTVPEVGKTDLTVPKTSGTPRPKQFNLDDLERQAVKLRVDTQSALLAALQGTGASPAMSLVRNLGADKAQLADLEYQAQITKLRNDIDTANKAGGKDQKEVVAELNRQIAYLQSYQPEASSAVRIANAVEAAKLEVEARRQALDLVSKSEALEQATLEVRKANGAIVEEQLVAQRSLADMKRFDAETAMQELPLLLARNAALSEEDSRSALALNRRLAELASVRKVERDILDTKGRQAGVEATLVDAAAKRKATLESYNLVSGLLEEGKGTNLSTPAMLQGLQSRSEGYITAAVEERLASLRSIAGIDKEFVEAQRPLIEATLKRTTLIKEANQQLDVLRYGPTAPGVMGVASNFGQTFTGRAYAESLSPNQPANVGAALGDTAYNSLNSGIDALVNRMKQGMNEGSTWVAFREAVKSSMRESLLDYAGQLMKQGLNQIIVSMFRTDVSNQTLSASLVSTTSALGALQVAIANLIGALGANTASNSGSAATSGGGGLLSLFGLGGASGNLAGANFGMGRASGGLVYGAGTGHSDSVPVRLSAGEYVMRASTVQKYGTAALDMMNYGEEPTSYPNRAASLSRPSPFGNNVANGDSMRQNVTINVHPAPNTSARVEESVDTNGSRQIDVIIESVEKAIAGNMSRGRGPLTKAMESQYGLNRSRGSRR